MFWSKFFKLLKMVNMMSNPQGATLGEMARKLHVDKRSVQRYISLLEQEELPIYEDTSLDGRTKRWKFKSEHTSRLSSSISIPDLHLNHQELAALYILKMQNRVALDTEIERHLNTAFRKISAVLPDNISDLVAKLNSIFLVNASFAKDYSGKEEILDDLIEATLNNRACRIEYYSFNSGMTKSYYIEPLYFFEHKGGLYLFARLPRRDMICTLAVERIQKFRREAHKFEYPEDFDPEEYLEEAFDLMFDDPVQGRLWFSEHQAKYLRERKYFQKQEITEQEDGSIIVDFETSGWWDVKSWVLSLGPDVEVLEPAEMREEIIEDIGKMWENYKE